MPRSSCAILKTVHGSVYAHSVINLYKHNEESVYSCIPWFVAHLIIIFLLVNNNLLAGEVGIRRQLQIRFFAISKLQALVSSTCWPNEGIHTLLFDLLGRHESNLQILSN